MLAILGMAAVCSIAVLTTMLTIKSLNKAVAIETRQFIARQTLYEKHKETIDHYQRNPITDTMISSTPISLEGLDYTYYVYPAVVRTINPPPLGYSLNSNYSTQHLQITSRLSGDLVQTPMVITGLACLQARSDPLSNNALSSYQLGDFLINPGGYQFNSDSGMIWKTTNAGSSLFMDLGFTAFDEFSRTDFAMISKDNSTKLVIVFAVTQSQSNKTDVSNNLYIVFDDFTPDQKPLTPLSNQDLTVLTDNHVASGAEKGYRIPLTSALLHVSAITTIAHQVIFITQQVSMDQQTGTIAYENLLYQINLSSAQGPLLNIIKLPDTPYILNIAVQQTDITRISLQTQADLELFSLQLYCNRLYQYED